MSLTSCVADIVRGIFSCSKAMSRLRAIEGGRINQLNELVLTSQENRERQRNYETCLKKLSEMLTLASIEPVLSLFGERRQGT